MHMGFMLFAKVSIKTWIRDCQAGRCDCFVNKIVIKCRLKKVLLAY